MEYHRGVFGEPTVHCFEVEMYVSGTPFSPDLGDVVIGQPLCWQFCN